MHHTIREPLSMNHETAKEDLVFIFGNDFFLRVASTGRTNPEILLNALQSISKVPVRLRIEEPSRFTPKKEL